MSDDFLAGDILASDDLAADADFDPNAVDSDAFLDDPKEDVLDVDLDGDLLGEGDEDDEDDMFEDE
jgi:hypothetical protein